MSQPSKNLCIFIHFSNAPIIPYNVELYVNELSNFFDELILIGNKRLINLNSSRIKSSVTTLFVENEGYDFGMFYKALKTINTDDYNQIACVNDSNILFNTLETIFSWGNNASVDFWGLIDSHQKPKISIHQKNYHIQSHFMVFNKKAIEQLDAYFKSVDVEAIIGEKELKKCRNLVINHWEIGLTQFMIQKGLTCKSYIDSMAYSQKYLGGKNTNISIKLHLEMIKDGYPLMKKKVITRSILPYSFGFKNHWKNTIKKYGNPAWDIKRLTDELAQINLESIKKKLSFFSSK